MLSENGSGNTREKGLESEDVDAGMNWVAFKDRKRKSEHNEWKVLYIGLHESEGGWK